MDLAIPDTTYLVIYVLKTNAHVRMVMVRKVTIVQPTTLQSVLRVTGAFSYPVMNVFSQYLMVSI